MVSILSEGFLGKKLYAVMAAMRFAANPPMLLWRVCSIWTMFGSSDLWSDAVQKRMICCTSILKYVRLSPEQFPAAHFPTGAQSRIIL